MLPLPALLVLFAAPPPQEPTAEDLDFFESRIRPVLAESCYECHSAQAKRPKGGFLLDTRDGLRKGGNGGAVIVPGDPGASRLIAALRYGDEELQMPPDGKLPDAVIADFAEWVRRGAPDPRSDERRDGGAAVGHAYARMSLEDGRRFWSFVPPQRPDPPPVSDPAWCSNEIDRFVLARLDAAGLHPAPPADRRTLIRRASFDLTGLPPTPAEVEAFLADSAPDAYARLVDRLLASPRYGERWGRYWLDLARYADSNGLDENLAMADAWRYRDYVIRAYNEDKPYDRFLTEQLAGDLLPDPGDEQHLYDQWTATGFLVLGPKMLAEQDKEKLSMDIVDEQIDVAGKAFLGLTVSCARCHDHKFDPVSQGDYYALAGIFRSTSVMANLDFVSGWRERALATPAQLDAYAAATKALEQARTAADTQLAEARRALHAGWQRDLARYLLAGSAQAPAARFVEAESRARGNLIEDRDNFGTPETVILRTGSGDLQFVEYELEAPADGRYLLQMRYASSEARPVRVLVNGAAAGEALGEVTGSFHPDGQRWRTLALCALHAGTNLVRLERDGPFPHLDRLLLLPADGALAPLEDGLDPEVAALWAARLARAPGGEDPVFAPWQAYAAGAAPPEGALAQQLLASFPPQSARELAGRYQALFAAVELAAPARGEKFAEPVLEELWQALHGPESPFSLPPAREEELFPEAARAALAQGRAQVQELQGRVPPAPLNALCAAEDKPLDLPIHIRGSHLNKAAQAQARGFPEVFAAAVPAHSIGAQESGRLQLAAWMADPAHPLTARVMVNRIWQGHFGAGLVRTPSNFGARGEPPTHPELLDWLATEFVRRGWSMKEMHREILLSSAYRMSCAYDAAAAAVDPENRLLWRQNRRRLEAEPVRDALLEVSGGLDPAMGGTLLDTGNRGYVTNDQSADQGRYSSRRRAVYLPVVRNALYDMFSTFDYADASVSLEQRPSSTLASQALFLLNSPLAVEESRRFADSLLGDAALPDDAARVQAAYERAYARAPEPEETAVALRYLRQWLAEGQEPPQAWERFCQALYAADEFVYVD